jgi:HEAT repeat protein
MRASSTARWAFAVGFCVSALSGSAFAGRGGSTAALVSAINSGSSKTIVAEIERAEFLACTSCIQPIVNLVDHPSEEVREAAGWWLSRRGTRTEILGAMTARLATSNQDPIAARNAADVLRGMRDPAGLAALTGYIARPLDETSGRAAAKAIGAIGHPSALGALRAAFSSTLPGLRAAAVESIRQLRAPTGATRVTDANSVLPLLSDSDSSVRLQATLTCGFLRDGSAVTALGGVVAADPSPLVRKAAAWALGEIGDGSASPLLRAAQSDSDPLVRSIATAALGRLR